MITVMLEMRPVASLIPNPRNVRTHPKDQINKLARIMRTLGVTNPPLIDENDVLIAGHGRLEAAKLNKMTEIPVLVVRGLDDKQKRLLMLADNRIAADSGNDRGLLATEVRELLDLGGALELAGFEVNEIDELQLDHEAEAADPADEHPPLPDTPVSKRGDLWLLGEHRLLCGDSSEEADVGRVFGDDRSSMTFRST